MTQTHLTKTTLSEICQGSQVAMSTPAGKGMEL